MRIKSETDNGGSNCNPLQGIEAHTHMPQYSDEIILAAIAGFEQKKTYLDEQIARLKGMLTGRGNSLSAAGSEAPRTRRKVSAAARRRMREAQIARWARVRGETASSSRRKTES